MKTTKWIMALTVIASMVFTTNSQAEGNGKRGEKRDLSKLFAKIDADGNGKLSLEEFLVGAEERRARRQERRGNRNSDRPRPTPEEVFKKMDADGDGGITLDEMKTAIANRKAHRGKGKGNRGGGNAAGELGI